MQITDKIDHPNCQIYLITPPVIKDLARFCDALEAALSAAPVACLQIRLKDMADEDIIHHAPVSYTHLTLPTTPYV